MDIIIKMSEINCLVVAKLERLFRNRQVLGHPETDWACGGHNRSAFYKQSIPFQVENFQFHPATIVKQFEGGGCLTNAEFLSFSIIHGDSSSSWSHCGSCSAGMTFELLPKAKNKLLAEMEAKHGSGFWVRHCGKKSYQFQKYHPRLVVRFVK